MSIVDGPYCDVLTRWLISGIFTPIFCFTTCYYDNHSYSDLSEIFIKSYQTCQFVNFPISLWSYGKGPFRHML